MTQQSHPWAYIQTTVIQKDAYIPMFIALFTTDKLWNQIKCPSASEQIKMWYIYKEKFSTIKKKNECYLQPLGWVWSYEVIKKQLSSRKTNTISYHLDVECEIQQKLTYV